MSNKSTKTNTKFRQTDRRKTLINGVLLSLLLVATPFLFYIYKYAPAEGKEWDTIFGTITASGFSNVQSFMHATFTKLTFIILTGMWFLTSAKWWKYAILVPFTMFLFQFIGVLNYELKYIDEFDFWYSLPIILPILAFLIWISIRISKRESPNSDLKIDIDEEIKRMLND